MRKIVWAPWRMEYIRGKKEKGCVFCREGREKRDDKNYLLYRGRRSFVVLNRFPYINGHLMIIPYRHLGEIGDLSPQEMTEMFGLVARSVKVLKRSYRPEGFNVGMNIGKVAGAGIAGHLHLHVVPRWAADTNFLPVLSETRCLSEHLRETYRRLKKEWGKQ